MRNIVALCLVMVMTLGVAWAQTTYEQLTSIADIDESAQYVLGIDGTGFHYEGTSNWGKTALPSAQTPIYYTLTKADDGSSFTAQATIEGTTYYLQIPTSNTFSMATEAGTNTDIIIGTTQVSGTNYAVANKTTTARHLRINGTSGLRSYAGTTGTMAFFYKVIPASGTTYTVTYYSNIAGIDPIEEIYNEGATIMVADNTFVNLGYAFVEWTTEEDGSGDSYLPGDEIEDLDADIDLYAQWEVSNEMTLTFPLNSNPGDWPTTNSSTLEEYTYALGGVDYIFALKNVKCNTGYLMIYSVGAVGLPAIEGYKLTKVVAKNSGGCSTSTKVGISSSASSESYIDGGDIQTWSTTSSSYTYNLTSTEGNTMYYLYVTNKNAQVVELALTYEVATTPTVATPTFDPVSGTEFGNEGLSVTISCETEDAEIFYTLDGTTPDNTSASYSVPISLATTTTVKAIAYDGTDYSNVATATYTYVDPNAPGTENNPYTVEQARAAIDANSGTQGVYATGIVSQVVSYNNNYHSITYWISDDGTTTNQLEAYGGISGIDGWTFSSVDDIEVGATVVIYGNLKKYSSTYEFDLNNELVSYTAPIHAVEAPTFSPAAGTYTDAQNVTISCETTGASIYYTTDGSEPTNESTEFTTAITVESTTTIKAIAYVGSEFSPVASATYHFCSADNPYTVAQALNFTEYPANGIYVSGIVSTAPTQNPTNNGELTYYISADGTATDQLEVYKGKGLNEAAFTAQNDIQVGDIVTVYGNVQVYNDVIEFGNGNYLVSFERPVPVLEPYDLTVSALNEHVNAIYVFAADDQNDPLIAEGLAGTVQVLEGTDIIVSPDVEEGYVLTSLTVLDDEGESVQPEDHMIDGGYFSFTMPSGNVTITATAEEAQDYELFSGDLVEGDYLIVYDGGAMNHTVLSDRLQYEAVTATDDIISTSNAEIVWHIAPSGDYWTIYSADADAYAASTGAKNKAQMLEDGTDDKALWTVTVSDGTYEFVNKQNTTGQVNANLRRNGTYGFACYATSTGGALSLYKKVEEIIEEPCDKILVNANNTSWSEDFEDDAEGITNPYTGRLPQCWLVVEEYTSDVNDVTPPQVYYKPEFNAIGGGSYSLRMRFRSMLAMPELDEEVDFDHLKMSLYVRQSFWSYKLEIGVITDIDNPDESYHLVATVNNSDKNMNYFECNFSSVKGLVGEGRYIVFKNVGGSEGDLYSNNYLDNIMLLYVDEEEQGCLLAPDYTEGFEYVGVGMEPDCWEVITEDVRLESGTRPQVNGIYNTTEDGENSLRLKNRCVYAMPEFQSGYNVSDYTMIFQLRQPNSLYRLQVGVVDEQGEFTAVKTLKCSGTEFEEKTVNFSGYEGRIAFRNTLVPGTGRRTDYLDYSINYIDDIHFTSTEEDKIAANGENVLDTDLESIAVYPNPTTGNLYIDAIGIQKVECYNQMGQLVRVYDNVRNSIDLNNLSEGVYTLRITVPQGVTMRKVVKR